MFTSTKSFNVLSVPLDSTIGLYISLDSHTTKQEHFKISYTMATPCATRCVHSSYPPADLKVTMESLSTTVEEGSAVLEAKEQTIQSNEAQLQENQTKHSMLSEKVPLICTLLPGFAVFKPTKSVYALHAR